MLREILNEKIAEQRQDELEKQERKAKQAQELKNCLSSAEKELINMIESAPFSLFTVPENCNPIIVIDEQDSKANYEKKYSVFTGYYDETSNIIINNELGSFTLSMSYLFSKISFEEFFSEDKPIVLKGTLNSEKNSFTANSVNVPKVEGSLEATVFIF